MADLSQRQQTIKDTFIENRGFWATVMEYILQLSPDFF